MRVSVKNSSEEFVTIHSLKHRKVTMMYKDWYQSKSKKKLVIREKSYRSTTRNSDLCSLSKQLVRFKWNLKKKSS